MIKVAVLMSTYNGERYLAEQIDSILNQKGGFLIDLYVRDDGSNDNTTSILNLYQQKRKLVWYTGKNIKPAKSFYNLLLHCTDYDYYAFSDQDDFWEESKIQNGISHLASLKEIPALYCSNAELVDDKLNYLGRNVYKTPPKTDFETVLCAGGLLGCTMILNAKLVNMITKVQEYPRMVLHDFYVAALCASIGGKIIYDNSTTMKYRQHESNVVGVSHGFLKTVQARFRDITYHEPIGISGQANSILSNYADYLDVGKRKWLCAVANYRHGIINRFKLAFSSRTKYINRNIGIKLRLSILLGNR